MKIERRFLLLILGFLFLSSACFAQIPTQTLSVSGLKENVTVRRDGRSIPYIEAKNEADLYFAQGFVTASDRLWQMDLCGAWRAGERRNFSGN